MSAVREVFLILEAAAISLAVISLVRLVIRMLQGQVSLLLRCLPLLAKLIYFQQQCREFYPVALLNGKSVGHHETSPGAVEVDPTAKFEFRSCLRGAMRTCDWPL